MTEIREGKVGKDKGKTIANLTRIDIRVEKRGLIPRAPAVKEEYSIYRPFVKKQKSCLMCGISLTKDENSFCTFCYDLCKNGGVNT